MPDPDHSELPSKTAQTGGSEGSLLHFPLLNFLLENIPVRIYFKDKESRFIRISGAMAKFHGLKSHIEAIGKTDFDFFTEEHAAEAFADEQQVMRIGEPIVDKVEKETLPDGSIRWALTTKMPLRNLQDEIIGTCGITQDVTAHKELEDALAASNEELRKRREELEATVAALREAHQKMKTMQQQLLDAEKMQAVGRFVYGVAHEIRNPLNICQAGLDFFEAASSVQEDPAQMEILQELKTAIGRADAVIDTLMDMSESGNLELSPCDLNGLVERCLERHRAGLERQKIAAAKDLAPDLPPVRLDASKIEQVIDGVITNAVAAMPGGGELTARTRIKELTNAEIGRDPGLRSAGRFHVGESVVLLEVEDTGPGIPEESLSKVFDAFFTTKETGEGTGLGLTVCRKIVELHNGAMALRNREEGGVCVSMILKRA